MKRSNRSGFVFYSCCVALLALLTTGPIFGQTYPNKSVRLVVPAPPGGGTDFLARLVGQHLSEKLGQTFIVDNVPGANGNIGAAQVARSAPDGYTLMMSYVGTQAINPSLYKKLTYQQNDLEPIAQVASYPFIIAVHPSLPVKTLKDLAEYGRTNKSGLSFGTAGVGSGGHLVGEMFNKMTGTSILHVPYKGSAPATTDAIAGRLQVVFDTLSTAGPYIEAGKLRPLAVTSGKRLEKFPTIPTVSELGFPELTISGWYGLFGRKGTPASIVKQLNNEIGMIINSKDIQERLSAAGYERISYRSPEDFGRFVNQEAERWGTLVKQSGAAAE